MPKLRPECSPAYHANGTTGQQPPVSTAPAERYLELEVILARKIRTRAVGSTRVKRVATHVQRKIRSAKKNEIPPHTAKTSKRPDWEARVLPSRIVARNASLRAVRGNILMKG